MEDRKDIPLAFIKTPVKQSYQNSPPLWRTTEIPNISMVQVTPDKGSRYYEVTDDDSTWSGKYTSVTSLIGNTLRNFGIERWKENWIRDQLKRYQGETLTDDLAIQILTAADKELKRSAELGIHVHDLIEQLLHDQTIELNDHTDPIIRAWLKWRERFIEWELVGTELGVFNGEHDEGYGGQVDALFRCGNEFMVVDWKTSSGLYDSSYLQVSAYAKAIERMNPYMSRVKACVVRLVNDYPKTKDGKKDRMADKKFNGSCEYAMVDTHHWGKTFDYMRATLSGTKSKVVKVKLND